MAPKTLLLEWFKTRAQSPSDKRHARAPPFSSRDVFRTRMMVAPAVLRLQQLCLIRTGIVRPTVRQDNKSRIDDVVNALLLVAIPCVYQLLCH